MKTILLVDGEPECLRCHADILNRFGYEVIARQDGQSALSVVTGGVPVDLVITELRIAGMDGLELLNALKNAAPAVPTIMLTSSGTIETYLKAINLGVFEFLNKPVKTKEMGRIVQAAFERACTLEQTDAAPNDARWLNADARGFGTKKDGVYAEATGKTDG